MKLHVAVLRGAKLLNSVYVSSIIEPRIHKQERNRMPAFKAGDRVKIADRAATPQDMKHGLFYNHYRGLTGIVQKAYRSNEMAVEVDLAQLPEDLWKRHMQTRDQMRQRWLESLTEDARRKLRPEQKTFDLRYVVLVSAGDLVKQRASKAAR